MNTEYKIYIPNPLFDSLGYIVGVANLNDKHDRSAPSDYHWKILKCRMIIFSNSSVLACPDSKDVKQVHLIFSKKGDDYDKITSLFIKFSLLQEGEIQSVNEEIYRICFQYTMLARMAPIWNSLGSNYLINNRDFIISNGPQNGIEYHITTSVDKICLNLRPLRLILIKSRHDFSVGDNVRVLPSLNGAVVQDCFEVLPENGSFKNYKDIRRHWKNIHGYRLPDEECSYYLIRFWRGEPLTYPKICVTSQMPIVVPVGKHDAIITLSKFVNNLKNRMPYILRDAISIIIPSSFDSNNTTSMDNVEETSRDTQNYSLCTPTQISRQGN